MKTTWWDVFGRPVMVLLAMMAVLTLYGIGLWMRGLFIKAVCWIYGEDPRPFLR